MAETATFSGCNSCRTLSILTLLHNELETEKTLIILLVMRAAIRIERWSYNGQKVDHSTISVSNLKITLVWGSSPNVFRPVIHSCTWLLSLSV
jgi:hypothetical protein